MRLEKKTEGDWTTLGRRKSRDWSARWECLISVFVDNLPESTTAEQLRNAFLYFGRIADAFIPASGRRGVLCVFGRKKRPLRLWKP